MSSEMNIPGNQPGHSGSWAKRSGQSVVRAFGSARVSLQTSMDQAPPELKRPAKRLLIGAIILLVVIAGWKYYRFKHEENLRAQELAAGPRVRTAKVSRSPGEHEITVIGETRPFQSVTLFAKVSGYLKSVKVDKGDVVTQGQVLAVIESPETEQEYHAAYADARNKHDIAARTMTLRAKGLVSEQEAEQAQSDADVTAAKLRSQGVQKGYQTLRAPFAGTVTARFADPGALVQNATNSQASALPVVTIAQVKQLRVDVFLDQRDAPFVVKDEPVTITLSERPGLKILGRVDRLSDELDPRTKMMLTEIDIPNDNRQLVAGSFVQVTLKVKSPPYLEAPVESLVLKQTKAFLSVVGKDNQLTYKPVEIASNDGRVLRLLGGVAEGELVALNVGDVIPEGGKVRPIVEEATPGAGKPVVDSKAEIGKPASSAKPVDPAGNAKATDSAKPSDAPIANDGGHGQATGAKSP